MDTKATATLRNGNTVGGRLTTAHALSSYGQPVFVDDDGQAYNWIDIVSISTAAAELGRKGGSANTNAQNSARAKNGKTGGRPKGSKNKPKVRHEK